MLIARIQKYHPSADVTQIEKAYNLAKKAHGDQKRKSGEPYIIHPLWVAIILADLEMDKETIIAALLHDVVEDTRIGEDYIKEEFGEEVALLVDGVTKLGRVAYSADKLELHQADPVILVGGQGGDPGGESAENVPCHGKGYPGHYH